MHVWEGTLRPKDGDIERTCEWWQGMLKLGMDGDNSVLIIRHTFDDLAHEQRVFDGWTGSECYETFQKQFNKYVDGPLTSHRYAVLHSY